MKYCFCKTNKDVQIHHIQPRIKGGSDEEINKIKLCHRCHKLIHKLGIYDKNMINDISKIGIEYYFINGYAQKYCDKYSTNELDFDTLVKFCSYILNEVAYSNSKHADLVKIGIANAAAKCKLIGRPTTTIDDIPSTVTRAYELFKNGKINKSECARMCGISRPCLDKYIKIIEGSL